MVGNYLQSGGGSLRFLRAFGYWLLAFGSCIEVRSVSDRVGGMDGY
jgi:hypothetical protein